MRTMLPSVCAISLCSTKSLLMRQQLMGLAWSLGRWTAEGGRAQQGHGGFSFHTRRTSMTDIAKVVASFERNIEAQTGKSVAAWAGPALKQRMHRLTTLSE